MYFNVVGKIYFICVNLFVLVGKIQAPKNQDQHTYILKVHSFVHKENFFPPTGALHLITCVGCGSIIIKGIIRQRTINN